MDPIQKAKGDIGKAKRGLDDARFLLRIAEHLPDGCEPSHFDGTYESGTDARVMYNVHSREEGMEILRKYELLPIGHKKNGTTKVGPVEDDDTWADTIFGSIAWDHNTNETCMSSLKAWARVGAARVKVLINLNGDDAYLVNIGGPGGKPCWRFREEPHAAKIIGWMAKPAQRYTFLLEDEDEPGACTYEEQLGIWEEN